jgi:hypothetical protein
MTTDNGQAWVSLKQAAVRLGLSEKTIRRRVAVGRLEGRKLSTPTGPAWLIRVDDVPPTVPREGVGIGTAAPTPDGLVELLRMLDERDRTIMELSGRVGYYQAQTEQLRETIRALEAPTMAPESTPPAAAVSRPATRPWWRFW